MENINNIDKRIFSNKMGKNKHSEDIRNNLSVRLKKYDKFILPSILFNKINKNEHNKKINKFNQLQNLCQNIYSSREDKEQDLSLNEKINEYKMKNAQELKKNYLLNLYNIPKNFKKYYINQIIQTEIKSKKDKNKVKDKINEDGVYLTNINDKKDNIENLSFNDSTDTKKKYNYENYASNKLVLNHPKLYILNKKSNFSEIKKKNQLPKVYKKKGIFSFVGNMSKLIPEKKKNMLEKIYIYDEYLKIKGCKSFAFY